MSQLIYLKPKSKTWLSRKHFNLDYQIIKLTYITAKEMCFILGFPGWSTKLSTFIRSLIKDMDLIRKVILALKTVQ